MSGCGSPALPPEVRLAEIQEHSLWKAGAGIYAPEEYGKYKGALRQGREDIIRQEARLPWFRDYKPVSTRFKDILRQGEKLSGKIEAEKARKSVYLKGQIDYYRAKVKALGNLTCMLNEGRLSRADCTKAEVYLMEAEALYERGEYQASEEKLQSVSEYMESAEGGIRPIISRYGDRAQVAKWREMVETTLSESKVRGTYAVVISKVDRKLVIYRNGLPQKTYDINIGSNGFSDKLYQGDNATPEGRYKIIRKLPRSRYYRALLINYPNDEDRRQFAEARAKGLIPAGAGIGGLVEIHGGGRQGMTYGCIALENRHMAEVYDLIDVGTPVTIVGAMDHTNKLTTAAGKP